MNVIFLIDSISFLASFIAMIVLLNNWKRAFILHIRLLLACVLLFTLFYNFFLVMQWSGITDMLDPFEDLTGALIPMWWAFLLYGFWREKAENDVRDSENRYRRLFEQSNDIIIVHKRGHIVDVNRRACEMLGQKRDELIGKKIKDIFIDESDRLDKITSIRESESVPFESNIKNAQGETIDVEVSAGVTDPKNGIIQVIVRDIRRRKKSEKELRESERRFRRLVDHAGDAFFTHDMEGHIKDVNQQACDSLGYSIEELLNMKIGDIDVSYSHLKQPKMWRSLVPGITVLLEGMYKKKNGNKFPVEIRTGVIAGEKNNHILSLVRDISERKRMEEEKRDLRNQLVQAQKVEAIGTLAGGIAHDFNNILTPMLVHAEMAIEDIPEDDPLRFNLDEIFSAAKRARELVKHILKFSRQSEVKKAYLRLTPIIDEVTKLLKSTLPSTVEIKNEILPETGTVFADSTQIQQVLMNLCTNAAYAMRDRGGILCIELVEIDMEEGDLTLSPDLKPGRYKKISVRDTGCGIDPDVMEKIFNPYFTTKGVGEGTGLGLSVVHGIVKDHGGAVAVESNQGSGSVFHVFLPKVEGGLSQRPPESDKLPKGTERILYVDDEKAMVDAIVPMLERLGYSVTSRTSGIEALEAFKTAPYDYDIVITDHTMPNITGDEMAQEMLAIRSDIPIILCTGYSEIMDERKAKDIGIREFALKPLVRSEIAGKIRDVLDNYRIPGS